MLDAAVRAAYGIGKNKGILTHLLALNHACAEKEKAGEKSTPRGLPPSPGGGDTPPSSPRIASKRQRSDEEWRRVVAQQAPFNGDESSALHTARVSRAVLRLAVGVLRAAVGVLRRTVGVLRLAVGVLRGPYYDTNPLANLAVPEVREYMVMGMIDNVENGLPSDIVSIVFAG